jgi:hypothetical protein
MLRVYPIEITFISFCLATYDKLTPWHICLHGGIDGGSHFLLWAVVSINKKKEIIFARYSTIVLIKVQESFLGSSQCNHYYRMQKIYVVYYKVLFIYIDMNIMYTSC